MRKSNLISEKQIDHLIRYFKWAQFVWLFLLLQYSLPSSAQLKYIAPARLGPTFSVCYKVPLPIFYCTTSFLFCLVWPKFCTQCKCLPGVQFCNNALPLFGGLKSIQWCIFLLCVPEGSDSCYLTLFVSAQIGTFIRKCLP